jgi:hypothetical protein
MHCAPISSIEGDGLPNGTTSVEVSSAADKLYRRSVELLTVSVGYAHGTPLRTQLWTNGAKLACEAISFIDRAVCIFKDHSALAFELRADDEIKIEVRHWSPLPSSTARNLAESDQFRYCNSVMAI